MVMPSPTDAITQTLVQADVAWAFGLIDLTKKRAVEAMQNEVVDLVRMPLQASHGGRESCQGTGSPGQSWGIGSRNEVATRQLGA